jgi:hypothetical protein
VSTSYLWAQAPTSATETRTEYRLYCLQDPDTYDGSAGKVKKTLDYTPPGLLTKTTIPKTKGSAHASFDKNAKYPFEEDEFWSDEWSIYSNFSGVGPIAGEAGLAFRFDGNLLLIAKKRDLLGGLVTVAQALDTGNLAGISIGQYSGIVDVLNIEPDHGTNGTNAMANVNPDPGVVSGNGSITITDWDLTGIDIGKESAGFSVNNSDPKTLDYTNSLLWGIIVQSRQCRKNSSGAWECDDWPTRNGQPDGTDLQTYLEQKEQEQKAKDDAQAENQEAGEQGPDVYNVNEVNESHFEP